MAEVATKPKSLVIKITADAKFLKEHGLLKDKEYKTVPQDRNKYDTSSILYIKNPRYRSGDVNANYLVALIEDEYQIIIQQ